MTTRKTSKSKRKLSKYDMVNKRSSSLEVNEITSPRTSGRYRGVSVGRDKNGFFVTTHRARSKSYKTATAIPDSIVKRIKSTG